jgi:hypothetical protein
MPKFVSRIELLNADKKDYQLLQEEMKKESFDLVRRSSSKSTTKLLTPVEYTLEGNVSLSDATDATWRAARRTGKKYLFTIIRQKMGYEFERAGK